MNQDEKRKAEVLKFTDALLTAGVNKVRVNYSGDGDEGRSEPPQFQDAQENPIDESTFRVDLDADRLAELLEGFAPEGYEEGEGGHGTITFDLRTRKIRVEHYWYETVSNPADPREI